MPPKRKDSRRNRDAPAFHISDYAARKALSNEESEGRKQEAENRRHKAAAQLSTNEN